MTTKDGRHGDIISSTQVKTIGRQWNGTANRLALLAVH